MNKKELLSLALGTVGLMGLVYNYVQAGSFTDNGSSITPKKVAKELVDVGAVNATSVITRNYVYKPSDIDLGSLTGPTISVSVDNGKIFVGTGGVAICNSTNNTIASLDTGNQTNQLVFSNSSVKISNNVEYYIRNSTCNGDPDLRFEVPKGASSVTLTIKTGSATTQKVHDSASATIITVAPQFSAAIDNVDKLGATPNKQIDYAYEFKKFHDNTTTDTGIITLKEENLFIKAQSNGHSNATTLIVTLKPTDMAGIASAIINNGTNNSTCVKGADSFTCNATYNISNIPAAGQDFTIYVNVTGTDVLSERKFTVDAFLDFDAPNVADKVLLTNADFGQWLYRGTTIYVPLIGVDPTKGRETYIKLQSRDTNPTANKVRAIILTSDGSVVTSDLGQITPGQPFTIKGSDLVDKVNKAGKTVGDSFAAILIITTDEANLFGYANIIDPSGAKRVPLKTRNVLGIME